MMKLVRKYSIWLKKKNYQLNKFVIFKKIPSWFDKFANNNSEKSLPLIKNKGF